MRYNEYIEKPRFMAFVNIVLFDEPPAKILVLL
jgi:hypothetical protein